MTKNTNDLVKGQRVYFLKQLNPSFVDHIRGLITIDGKKYKFEKDGEEWVIN